MAKKTIVKVVQDETTPVQIEVLAEAIVQLDEATKKLLKSGLNRRALVVLLAAMMPAKKYGSGRIAGPPAIVAVLDALDGLRKEYCTK